MSTFGREYRVTTYGESHCKSVGCIIDGVPPGLALSEEDIQVQLTRRRPGQSALTTPRNEKDRVTIQSGCEFGYTLGTPICLTVANQDHRPRDYSETDLYPRPSHADYTYLQKYGVKASSGGGRSSARETIGRVAAGAVAEKYLSEAHGVEIVAFVSSVGGIEMAQMAEGSGGMGGEAFQQLLGSVTRAQVDGNAVRCPDEEAAQRMQEEILECSREKNSTGGTVTCVIRNAPAGLGEPCFDKLEAQLAHAMMSIPATKGFEVGSGFSGTRMQGSEHNDAFEADGQGGLRTRTNHSGGIQGGISNGQSIFFRVAFKPPATISQDQQTATYEGASGVLAARGRHDPCVVPRAVPIVEAMAAIVLMDAVLQQNGRAATRGVLAPVPAHLKGIKPV
ncbi:bifunctional chorismate synthase/riboflavin reductase [NAD(P)H] aro2 [Coemansia erecta]|uniref:Chorismate synthase n=1 Tax=Coemansia erecta TaxID=147472 RepID=A0A9W7Y281_9FUNG|nr:bifunctional chorismate synthase/riboflavin reductase [NAD(P)H] aro2 [Coemansia erecta]